MKNFLAGSLLGLATCIQIIPSAQAIPVHQQAIAEDTTFQLPVLLNVMKKVGSWQWKHIDAKGWTYPQTDWTNGAMYAGMMALNKVADNTTYVDRLLRVGADNNWNTGPDRFFADDYCIGQTYAQLYMLYKQPVMIAKFRALADSIAARPHDEPLDWKNGIHHREWAWCDALFMGPPALAYLSTATGDQKYIRKATELWWKTTDFLFDKEEQLFYRDARFFGQKEKNGAKVFWSRGNGWVMGGLARMMDNMPGQSKEKQRFTDLFKKMAYRVAKLQTADGTWHASLLDPDNYTAKESSGTGFFVYALTWGVNEGILPAKDFMPVIRKGWAALLTCVQPDGKLGFVQIPAAEPGKATADDTEVYGVGAFLLAGSELIRYELSQQSGSRISIINPTGIDRPDAVVEVPYAQLQAKVGKSSLRKFKIIDQLSGKEIPYQLVYEGNTSPVKLLLQVHGIPGGQVQAVVVPGEPAVFPVKTFGRYVPERKDDFAWENDRIAFRLYGPALDNFPKENAHGIDVWTKRTSELVVNNWYKLDNYHHDNGQGLDYYKVGLTLGAGDIAPYENDTLWYSKKYKNWKMLDSGLLRTTFQLTYDTWQAGRVPVSVVKTISLDAGSQLNRITVTYQFKGAPLQVASGIVRRPEGGDMLLSETNGVMGYWEPVHGADGTTGVGCIIPVKGSRMLADKVHLLGTARVTSGEPYVYYSGAVWDKAGRITSAGAWFDYLTSYAAALQQPLQVNIH